MCEREPEGNFQAEPVDGESEKTPGPAPGPVPVPGLVPEAVPQLSPVAATADHKWCIISGVFIPLTPEMLANAPPEPEIAETGECKCSLTRPQPETFRSSEPSEYLPRVCRVQCLRCSCVQLWLDGINGCSCARDVAGQVCNPCWKCCEKAGKLEHTRWGSWKRKVFPLVFTAASPREPGVERNRWAAHH